MKLCGKLQCNPDLSHAHGMEPDSSSADPRRSFRIENAESLECLVTVSAALPDAFEITGQKDQQDRNKEQIVEKEGDLTHDAWRRIRIRDSP